MTKSCKLSFRIMQFPTEDDVRFVGLAWDYDNAVLLSTRDKGGYTEAHSELASLAEEYGHELKYFDGEYLYDKKSGQLLPVAWS